MGSGRKIQKIPEYEIIAESVGKPWFYMRAKTRGLLRSRELFLLDRVGPSHPFDDLVTVSIADSALLRRGIPLTWSLS